MTANNDAWNKGWFRLVSARANMRDIYNDMITIIGPVGPSTAGAGWGFSVSNFGGATGTFKATYDLALEDCALCASAINGHWSVPVFQMH